MAAAANHCRCSIHSILPTLPPPRLLLLLLLLLLVVMLATLPPHSQAEAASATSARKVTVTSAAQLASAVDLSNRLKVRVEVTLAASITLLKALPLLQSGTSLSVTSACKSSKTSSSSSGGKGTSVTTPCVIDGADQFPLFVSEEAADCAVAFNGVTVQRCVGGVVSGTCNVTARSCTFARNRSPIGGAVFNAGIRQGYPSDQLPDFEVLIRNTTFSQNTATNGSSGGAIASVPNLRRMRLDIAFSNLSGNSATGKTTANTTGSGEVGGSDDNGSGGAIYLPNYDRLWLRNVTFSDNTADQSGGAIWTSGPYLQAIGAMFLRNRANNGVGGAVAVRRFPSMQARFCHCRFNGNSAPQDRTSDNLQIEANDDEGELMFCPSIPSGIHSRSTDGEEQYDTEWGRVDCVGCSGCDGDCYGHGACVLDSDYNPSCRCNKGAIPSSNCRECYPFNKPASGCTACIDGALPFPNGTCTACPGLTQTPFTGGWLYIDTTVRVPSMAACAAFFNQTKEGRVNFPHWNVWIYFDKSAAKGCANSCVMVNLPLYRDFCTLNRKPQYLKKHSMFYVPDEEKSLLEEICPT